MRQSKKATYDSQRNKEMLNNTMKALDLIDSINACETLGELKDIGEELSEYFIKHRRSRYLKKIYCDKANEFINNLI